MSNTSTRRHFVFACLMIVSTLYFDMEIQWREEEEEEKEVIATGFEDSNNRKKKKL